MSNVEPIKPGTAPTLDVERELRDYFAMQLREYVEAYGAPFGFAFVLVGPDHATSSTVANGWCPGAEETNRLHLCSVASTALLKRALGAL